MSEGIGEQSTLEAEGKADGTSRPPRPWDLVLQAQQAKVFGALFRKPVLRRFGRYVVLDVLGHGGMGVVLKGYDEELDRQVAIKVLHRELDELHTARLRREAQAMAKLSHPNVVQVYEVGQLEGQTFVAMELVEGQTVQAWMQQEPRPGWKACVGVFLQLGQGLAAAHERGLVHRDFKPGNAIIDEEGRARVLDFGLVRRAGDGGEDPSGPETSLTQSETPPLEASLTRTGAVLGTPAYMPPEQMSGLEVDARGDQFSFCVALYEAVYGQRPYEGSSMMGILVSMRTGTVRPVPRGSDVPAPLRKLLLRGLSLAPDDRWPSMEALLEALRRMITPRRWRWVALGVTVGLVVVGGGLGTTQTLAWLHRCTGARQQLEGAWDQPRRQEVQAAILGTGLSYAPSTWERIEPRLDAYADAWVAEHTDACEATRSRDERTEEEMSLRMGCLHGRWQHLRATVDELRHADATVVEHAVRAVTSLPGFERCRDLDALRAEVPPPEDPAVAARVAELDERLVEAKAKENAGLYADGLRLTDEVVAEGVGLGYEPLMARAWLRQGDLRKELGDYDGAVEALQRAYGAAVPHVMKTEAASAADELSFVLGYRLARPQAAESWALHAGLLAQADGTDEALARHLDSMGSVAKSQGRYDDARDSEQRALTLREHALGPDHPDVATSLNNLGAIAESQGKYDDARRLHERALAIWEEVLGPDHPDVAFSYSNLGNVAALQGQLDQARERFERALVIGENALGPDHPDVAAVLNNLGNVAMSQGRHDDARERFERALAIKEQALGPDHPDVALTLDGLGALAHSRGELEGARERLERALAIKEKARGPDHPDVAMSLVNLGLVAMSQGQHDDARERFERALAIKEQALGPDHPDVALMLVNLGGATASQGELERARGCFERALTIFERALGSDHPAVASTLVGLGTVMAEQGELEAARDRLERALTILEKTLGPDHPELTSPLYNLGHLMYQLGEHEDARARFEHALAIREKTLGPDNPQLATPLVGLGKSLLGLARPAQALPLLERAVSLRSANELDPASLAEARFVLAEALWAAPMAQGRDRPRSRMLAEQARDALREAGAASAKDLAEVKAWLAEQRLP